MFARTHLSLIIAATLGVPQAMAQESESPPPPTLYTAVDESEIYIIERDGTQTDVKTGESAVLTPDGVEFIGDRPAFLNWPCGTGFAANRGALPTFSIDDLPPDNRIGEVADRFFSNQQVLEGKPDWLRGQFHAAFPSAEIDQYVSNAFWYKPGPTTVKMQNLRPDTLLIGLFYGTGQVVVDINRLDELKETYGEDPIPVVFEYQDQNVVPVSYFGENAAPSQIAKGFQESGIKPADLPMWYAGDHHARQEPGLLADSMGVPPASEMNPERLAALEADIRANGFAYKPITLALIPGAERAVVDEPERLRAAAQAGIPEVPVQFSVYDNDVVAAQCGVQTPTAAAGLLGTKEGEAPGATPPDDSPPGSPPAAPPGQQPPSPPPRPIPPEIELPNPPQPELPGSPSEPPSEPPPNEPPTSPS